MNLHDLFENFKDGKNPQDKGDAKRHGINTKASVSSLRKTAKSGGRKGQLAHWLANMKSGRARAAHKESVDGLDEEIVDEWTAIHPDIRRSLETRGYKYLGHGIDQMAFLEPDTGWVLKIFGTDTGIAGRSLDDKPVFSQSHQMFFAWAKFCMGTDNPFLPQFDDYESFLWNKGTYLQIRQERLSEINLVYGGHLSIIARAIESIPGLKWKNIYHYDLLLTESAIYLVDQLGREKAQYFFRTLQALYTISNKYGYRWDMHSGNFMMRGPTPVIVDPWTVD